MLRPIRPLRPSPPALFVPKTALRAALALGALALVAGAAPLRAQAFLSICPGQTREGLQACLRSAYTPSTTYSYDRARDTLFAFVDDGDRTRITDVYAGYTLPIRPGQDPTKEGCNGDGDEVATTCNGARNMNTEHAYPQSKGAASGPANADLHHLFPARADVNSSRGNLPYGEASEAAFTKYYRLTQTVACPAGCPPPEAPTWSAVSTSAGLFRPRADRRGDVARAVFYFYTVYRAQADAADPAFFGAMKATLLAWHRADPPDAEDQARSARVRRYQGNDNPFAFDTTLARRAYFDHGATLPVELLALDGRADGDRVALAWATASETNNAGFAVELREFGPGGVGATHASPLPGADGWRAVGFVAGAGTTTERHAYALTTPPLAPGRYALRLRQTDLDGTAHLSPTVEVTVEPAALTLVVMGNGTAAPRVRVAGVRAPVDIRLYDVTGRAVAAWTLDATADLALPDGLAPGLYVVRAGAAAKPLVVGR